MLREYALLADGQRGILVGPRGDFSWMCFPSWDSEAVFCSLLGGGGLYALTPTDARYVWGGYYEDGSLIWRSRWTTTTGVVECREALSFPADPHTAVVLRRVMATDGPARVDVVLDVRAGFGAHRVGHLTAAGGVWSARTGDLRVRWSGGGEARPVRGSGAGVELHLDLPAGAYLDLVLEISDGALAEDPVGAGVAWAATEAAWADTVPELDGTLAPREARQAPSRCAGS